MTLKKTEEELRFDIMKALFVGFTSSAKPRIQATSDFNFFSRNESIALLQATSENDISFMKDLIKTGHNVNAPGAFELNEKEKGIFTPLMVAAWFGNRSALELLLSHGADKSIKDANGRTALELAKLSGRSEISRILRLATTVYIPEDIDLNDLPQNPTQGAIAEMYEYARYDEHMRKVISRGGIAYEEHEASRAQQAIIFHWAKQNNIDIDFTEMSRMCLDWAKDKTNQNKRLSDFARYYMDQMRAKKKVIELLTEVLEKGKDASSSENENTDSRPNKPLQ